LQDLRIAELETITARVLDALAETVDAASLTFLLRQYLSTDRADLRDALGRALASALEHAAAEPGVASRAGWLVLFAEVAAITDDERIVAAAGELRAGLRAEWPRVRGVSDASLSVEACLIAANLFDPHQLVPPAIDHLEHVIGGAYQPGEGVRGGLADQVRAASALLTAFEITGRLPYSMLAEELMQTARPAAADDTEATVEIAGAADMASSVLVVYCDAARVLCRLAVLHDDAEYRGAAVIASDARYRDDAARILASQSPRALAARPEHAAVYGLALLDLLK
jgi:hypothetical protein